MGCYACRVLPRAESKKQGAICEGLSGTERQSERMGAECAAHAQ